ncbi:hypothetical protein Goklo_020471 [Gossypium klotzschianum]|uniref:non-specific serine/threonine protein kinase n=2 Tax=Gossypium TaxID=3633 RepID=A0A7J8URY5_9ROSI|nr:hypothetical protein [Gossypium klotzschianum]
MKNPLKSLLLFFHIINKSPNNAKSDKSRGKGRSPGKQCSAFPEGLCRQFSLEEIKAAINSFREDFLLGRGGFGDLYKGIIDDGTMAVAIERFGPFGLRGGREFRTEVQLLCQLRHPNLVSFIGFCDEEDEKLLVYEYISNGSLDKHLYGNRSSDPLSWKQRLTICSGAARGLHYLHSGAKHSIIHRNIRSRNILLDDEWNPKLSDLSLSKMSQAGSPTGSLNIKIPVTVVHMDPECYITGRITRKTDVYAFGIVLFEVLCGRKAIDLTLEGIKKSLTSWACKCIENGTIYDIIDPYLKKKIAPQCFEKFVEIAYCCVCQTGKGRPEMGEVEMALEAALELQKTADSEKESVDHQGEYEYEELLPCLFVRNDIPDYGGNVVEQEFDSCSDVDSTISDSFLDSEVIQLATILNQG